MATPKTTHIAARGKRPTQLQPARKPARKPRRTATKTAEERGTRSGTKQAALLALLQRPKGATIAQMSTQTGWQSHSVRAALTGFRKRGIQVSRTKGDAGATIYRAETA
jgi:Protein of unknown function (DUF3489)